MTAVATFSGFGGLTTHLVADTLVSLENTDTLVVHHADKMLSTGLLMKRNDQIQYGYGHSSPILRLQFCQRR